MALVKFIACNAAAYAGGSKDNDTLYFVSDEQRLYKGAVPYSGGIYEAVSEFPEAGKINTLYIKTSTGEVKYWNGSAYTQVVKPFAATVSASDNGSLPTSKAVADYVAAEIGKIDAGTLAADIAALKKKDAEHDTAISTTLPAAIADAKKAGTDAAAAVKTLENGKVAANAAEITKLKSGKADKATTLAGYGIGDAYTKAQTYNKGEVDTAISSAVANAGHLKREILENLPEVGSANEHTIYMIGKGDASTTSNYKEYMLINGKFELVGDSKVDLTDYATKTYAETKATEAKNAAIADATDKIATAKQEAIDAAATDATQKANAAKDAAVAAAGTAADGKIATEIGKLDVTDAAVSGQYVSSVSETDGKIKVTRAPLPAAATLVEGTENGTVKFNGTDVKVHGLGSAAFAESSAFDTKGSAAAAQTEAIKQAKAYANSLASNYATAAQGAKADTALQQADVIEGTTQGAISVKGKAVKVHGLGDAAFKASSAFDAAGAATTAETNAKEYADSLAGNYATSAQGSKADQVFAALTWGTL